MYHRLGPRPGLLPCSVPHPGCLLRKVHDSWVKRSIAIVEAPANTELWGRELSGLRASVFVFPSVIEPALSGADYEHMGHLEISLIHPCLGEAVFSP